MKRVEKERRETQDSNVKACSSCILYWTVEITEVYRGCRYPSMGTYPKYTNSRKLSISCFVTAGISIGEESDFPSVVSEDPPA